VLAEGAADFIAQLVTGTPPDAERAAWAAPREAELWRRFEADLELTRTLRDDAPPPRGSPQEQALRRWIGNYSAAPKGWPYELGYWIGLRIWERRYAAAADKRTVLAEMLNFRHSRAILATGAFKP
jgi:hypothetical protein